VNIQMVNLNHSLNLFQQLVKIRAVEELLAERYPQQEMRTPVHFGIGQEAVAVGVCALLSNSDAVYSHHRCHNHYLACGGGIFELAAELFGKEEGCSKGRGGSVHLTARNRGFIASSAILGQGISAATGSALAFQIDEKPAVAVSFFGDAACEEGVFYESLNFSSIHKLPVLFVCENNLYSTESPLTYRQPKGSSLCDRPESLKIKTIKVDGCNVEEVYEATIKALQHIKNGDGPVFMECMTYRWREHVGPAYDHEVGRTYRSESELRLWMGRCPVKRQYGYLHEFHNLSKEYLDGIAKKIQLEVASEIDRASSSGKFPMAKDLFENC
jgi:TPP-dependent pyruvate/acetoin dehydrogenase alpha subunit